MKSFSERNVMVIGVVGAAVIAATVIGAINYDKLPFFAMQKATYSAYFAECSGLTSGAHVQVAGFQVGAVTGVELDGPRVLVTFNVDKDIHLGDRTEAAIKAKSQVAGSGTAPLDNAPAPEVAPKRDFQLV